MSFYEFPAAGGESPVTHVTAQSLRERKRAGQPISALTAYDYPTARLVDEAGIDLILVGDSVGMTVLGLQSTLPVTMEDMLHHTRAAARGVRRALLVADLPFGSYQTSAEDAVRNGLRLVKEAGAHAVKLEGGRLRTAAVERLTQAEVPVVGHLGLTPQSLLRLGGYRVQGRSQAAMDALREDARALEAAGAIALVLEGIPRELAALVTAECSVPTLGIGAGPDCDGQILVLHDVLGLTFGRPAKFVRRYVEGAALFRDALDRFRSDVSERAFPADAESYHLPRALREGAEAAGETPAELCKV